MIHSRSLGIRLFEITTTLIYQFAQPVISTASFFWIVKSLASGLDGVWTASGAIWLAVLPLLYIAWLIWFLLLCSLETQVHSLYMHYRKPARATQSDGFRSWLFLNASLMLYLRMRLVLSLPLVEAFLPMQGLRHLVLLSYARATHLGRDSLVLGTLFDPDITEVGESAIIGSGSSVLAHSMTSNADGSLLLVTSPITIGPRAVIGGSAQIHPGVRIGADSIIEPASYVAAFTQIGDGEVWGGSPARFIRLRNAPSLPEQTHVAGVGNIPLLDDATEVILLQLVAKVLHRPIEFVTPTLSALVTSAWDSLAQLGMTIELQRQFGILLTNQEGFRLRSMANLREVIWKSRAAEPGRSGS